MAAVNRFLSVLTLRLIPPVLYLLSDLYHTHTSQAAQHTSYS